VGDVLVLCYHAATPAWPSEMSVDPDVIADQVRQVLERGYRPVRFCDLLAGEGHPRRVSVTFDDAYVSVHREAWPALRELGVPATVFVPTDFASRPEPMRWPGIEEWSDGPHSDELRCMTWEQLGELQEAGWEVGSHTCGHPRLTACDDEQLERELTESRRIVAERLGACATIAYPYGDTDGRVMSATRRAGYDLAAGLPVHIRRPVPMAWPRLGIYRPDTDLRFRLKVSPVVRRLRSTMPGHRLTESEPPS